MEAHGERVFCKARKHCQYRHYYRIENYVHFEGILAHRAWLRQALPFSPCPLPCQKNHWATFTELDTKSVSLLGLHLRLTTKIQLHKYWYQGPAIKSPLADLISLPVKHLIPIQVFSFFLYKMPSSFGPCLSLLYPDAVLCPQRTNIPASSLVPFPFSLILYFLSLSHILCPLVQINLLCAENLILGLLTRCFPSIFIVSAKE